MKKGIKGKKKLLKPAKLAKRARGEALGSAEKLFGQSEEGVKGPRREMKRKILRCQTKRGEKGAWQSSKTRTCESPHEGEK